MVSDRNRNRGPEGVERPWNGCQGSRSIQVNRERHLIAQRQLFFTIPLPHARLLPRPSVPVNRLFLLLTNGFRLRGRPRGGERSEP
jgi:hypothetical protein